MTPTAATNNTNQSMLDKTICISVFLGGLGNNRKVRNSEVGIDSDDIHVSKTLLESPEYEAIKRFDRATIKWLNNKCIPSFFRAGIYCVPIPSVQEAEGFMKERFTGRAELVDKLLEVYDIQKAQAETRLGTVQVGSVQVNVYNPLEYPPKSAVQAAYKFEWNWINLGTPGKLKSISMSFFEQEQQKAAAKWAEATDQVKALMRSQFKELVDHLVDKLTPDEKGARKKFHATTVNKVKEFLDAFSVKNVTDDTELEQLVGATRKLMDGVDVDQIKDSDHLRSNIQKGFGIVKDCLDQLVVEGGTRKISFLEE